MFQGWVIHVKKTYSALFLMIQDKKQFGVMAVSAPAKMDTKERKTDVVSY